jgi:putative salt-induced outer membrane protein YdiY
MNKPQFIITSTATLCLAGASAAHAQVTTPPPAELPPPPKWESSVNAGLSYTSGNSDTLLVTAGIDTKRKGQHDEWAFGAKGAYGKSEGDVNNNMAAGYGQYNYLFTEKFYAYGRVDALYDGIADIDYQVNLSPGVGYYFIKNDRTTLNGEFGPGYLWEKKGGVADSYATLRFAERLEQKLGEKAKVWESLSYLPQIDDWGNYRLVAEIGIEAPIVNNLSLRLVANDIYNSRPAAGKEQNDFMLVGGVAYKF